MMNTYAKLSKDQLNNHIANLITKNKELVVDAAKTDDPLVIQDGSGELVELLRSIEARNFLLSDEE